MIINIFVHECFKSSVTLS